MPMTVGFSEPGVPGSGPPYPIGLERALRVRGVPVRAIVRSRIGHLSSEALTRFEDDILVQAPDIVIAHYGGADALPGTFPRWVRRWLYNHFPSQASPALRLRRLLLRRARHVAQAIEVRHGRARGPRAGRRSPERVRRDLDLLLESIHRLGGDPPVVLVGSTPAGPAWERAMPGYNARLAAIDDVLRELAAARCDRVEFVDLATELKDPGYVSIDGFHLSAAGHAAVVDVLEPLVLRLLEASSGGA